MLGVGRTCLFFVFVFFFQLEPSYTSLLRGSFVGAPVEGSLPAVSSGEKACLVISSSFLLYTGQ